MKINHKQIESTMYVALSGELDENAAEFARRSLDSLFDKSKMRKVVIDLSGLDFMDSTGIGVLIGRFKKLKAKQVSVCLANPTRTVDKILKLSGLYEIMPKVEY